MYRVACKVCLHQEDVFRRVDHRDLDLPWCRHCETEDRMERVLVAPMVQTDIQPYKSMIDGSMITSRSQHRNHLRDHNCIEIGNEVKHAMKPREMTIPVESAERRKKMVADLVDQKLRG